jgi:hypothetical protein
VSELPELKTASVVLKYHAKSGYRAECAFKSHADCPKPMDANRTLIAAAAEIARVVAVAGAGEEVRKAITDAIAAVYEDLPHCRPATA